MKYNRNQHYIPQYYLKNFSSNRHIHIYDLKNKKSFSNSIANTAYKKNFYNVDTAIFKNIIENEVFENEDFIDVLINGHNESILAAFFDSFNPTRERIVNNDKTIVVSIIDFHSLVDFVLMQTYRNPKLQLFFKKIQEHGTLNVSSIKYDKSARGIVILLLLNELYYGRKTQLKKEIIHVFAPVMDEIKIWKELLTNSYKCIYWNLTDIDFLTSDFAMSFKRINPEDVFTTIFVPINTKVGVLLMNKESSVWGCNPSIKSNSIIKIYNTQKSKVEFFNQGLIEAANRFVYSMNGYFPDEIKSVEYKEWWNI